MPEAAEIDELARLRFGPTLSSSWTERTDRAILRVLRPFIPNDSLCLAIGGLGRKDGYDCERPKVLLMGHLRHTSLIAGDLAANIPNILICLDARPVRVRELLFDARKLWGSLPAPSKPWGDEFAQNWLQSAIDRSRIGDGTKTIEALANWQMVRFIANMAGVPSPSLLDLPFEVQDLYTARNMGIIEAPDIAFASKLSGVLSRALLWLNGPAPISEVGAGIYRRLFE